MNKEEHLSAELFGDVRNVRYNSRRFQDSFLRPSWRRRTGARGKSTKFRIKIELEMKKGKLPQKKHDVRTSVDVDIKPVLAFGYIRRVACARV